MTTYGSVCSGIESATVAWESFGWEASWFSEIEKNPSDILASHYPDVKNHGDMTSLAEMVKGGSIEAPDVLVGGTPCQAFSIAGLREGLSDKRGQLTLSFVELANAIDTRRKLEGKPESIVVWENVPGVLTIKDNAFGCFLAGLAGESDPLQPPREGWSVSGCVYGQQRTIAWRSIDAKHFGVAQRRNRIFVVASSRDDIDTQKILFEFEGRRRDIAPGCEDGQRDRPKVAKCLTARGAGGGNLDPFLADYIVEVENGKTRVRRYTPIECERLQGFPDNYTKVLVNGKFMSDSARYQALGNSMPVPVMRWIGNRIDIAIKQSKI